MKKRSTRQLTQAARHITGPASLGREPEGASIRRTATEIALNSPSASPGTLLIRADANSAIGTGHVMRCLALAQAWQDAGGKVAFACTELPPFLSQRLETEGCKVSTIDVVPGTDRDLEETRRLAESIAPKWLVLDGYAFGPDFQLTLRDVKWRLLFIDDDGRHESYHADAILNQNAGAAAVCTESEPTTRSCCWAVNTQCCGASSCELPGGWQRAKLYPGSCSRWAEPIRRI